MIEAPDSVPVPAAAGRLGGVSPRVSSTVFVGRGHELDELRAAFERATTGEPGVVLIGGEAGVGKTRLVAELANQLRAGGATVLVGGCLELGEAVLPYAPLADALRALEQDLGRPRLEQLLGRRGQALLRLLPGAGPPGPDAGRGAGAVDGPGARPEPSSDESARLFEAVVMLLRGTAAEQPVVLVMEDLHWADRSTLNVLGFLARVLHDGQVLVVGTYRSDELHRRHVLRPVIWELARLRRVRLMTLAPLMPDEVLEQIHGILDEPPADALVAQVVDRSEGNPFYAEELVAWLRTNGRGRLPPTLRDVLTIKLEERSAPARQLLRAAAAAGRQVDHRLVEAVAGLPDETVAAALREVVDHQVLVASPQDRTLRFRHELVREAVTDDLLPGEHVAVHRTIAETLEQHPEFAWTGAGGCAAELAHHWYAAHDLDRAFTASLEAARAAGDVYAFTQGLGHVERALALWDRVGTAARAAAPPRWQVMSDAGDLAFRAGRAHQALAHLRGALAQVADGPAAVRAGLLAKLSMLLWKSGDGQAALEASEHALEAVPSQDPSPELAYGLAVHGKQLILLERHEEALPVVRRAVAIATDLGLRPVECDARNTLGSLLGADGKDDEGVAELQRALTIARDIEDVALVLRAHVNLGFVLSLAGRPEEAIACGFDGIAWSAERNVTGAAVDFLRANQVDVLWRLGRWDEADGVAAAMHPPEEEDNVLAIHHAITVGRLRAWQGRFAEAHRLLARARGAIADGGSPQFAVGQAMAQLELAVLDGDLAPVQPSVERLEQLFPGAVFHDETLVGAVARPLVALARDAVAVADDDRRRWAVDRLDAHLEAAREELARLPAGSYTARLLGADIRQGEAERTRMATSADPAAWAAAVAATAEVGRPHVEGYLRWRHAQALLDLEAGQQAVYDELAAARAIAERLGAAPLRDAVDDCARRARIALPGMPSRDGVAALGLTPREHEVLMLVAQGRTNRQIGESLYISPKTASVHVSNILAKLDVTNREDAATAARRLGVVPDG